VCQKVQTLLVKVTIVTLKIILKILKYILKNIGKEEKGIYANV